MPAADHEAKHRGFDFLWKDVAARHSERPLHAVACQTRCLLQQSTHDPSLHTLVTWRHPPQVGTGDQLYNDDVFTVPSLRE